MGEKFVQEIVVGVGFLNGIFMNTGVDPEGVILESLIQAMESINPSAGLLRILLVILSLIVGYFTIIGALENGGELGLLALILGFIGGLIITYDIWWIFLIGGLFLGILVEE